MVAKVTKPKDMMREIYGTTFDKKRSHHKKVPPVMSVREISKLTLNNIGLESTCKPATKPATILYKKLPDNMILITGIESFINVNEIFDKYGRIVATTYESYQCKMTGEPGMIFLSGLTGFGVVRIGQVYNKHDFSKIIAHVKKCGGLLHDIIQAVNGGEVKRIEI
jgi:hypothetical protein